MNPLRPPRQRLKEVRPQQLLDAALVLFVEKGFAATRSEEVAQHAGVSKGTLYLYYPSKEELFKAVVRQNLAKLIGEGAEIVGSFDGPTSELLVRLFDTWWDRVADSDAGGLTRWCRPRCATSPTWRSSTPTR
jgi:TetR/AcrR family transcriptional regulator